MALLTSLTRRFLWVLLLGLAGGAAAQWWRERQAPSAPAPPEWPPIEVTPAAGNSDDEADDASARAASTPSDDAPVIGAADATAPASIAPTAMDPDDAPVGAASVVNSLVDAPEARSTDGAGGGWVEPGDDGACPISHPVKANDNSGIFHVPGGRFYERTKAERCYADPDAAAADGYRRAKS